MLESPELRQLKQRIGVRWRLRPLSPSETREYVRHRLRVAAGAARDVFSQTSLRELHRLSGGIPRVVNVLCDRALLAGYAGGAREIGPSVVRAAAAEVRGDGNGGWLRRRLARPALLDVSLAAALIACVGLWLWFSRAPLEAAPVSQLAPADVAAPPPTASEPAAATTPAPVTANPAAEPAPAAADPAPLEPTAALAPEAPPMSPASYAPAPAEPASAVPSPVAAAAPVSAPEPALPPLGVLLAAESVETSAENALGALLTAWGLAPEVEAPHSLGEVLEALASRRLGVLALPAGDLASLRALNHPALLRIKAADGSPRLVVLRALDSWQATLAGVGPSGAVRLSAAELEALWGGEAWVPWRDFEALPDVLQVGGSGRALLWLQQSLATLGFYAGPLNGHFDGETQTAVRAFQRSRALSEDGTVGPRTKMALYDSLGRYQVPRLQTGREIG
jgi:general secretion pathway protein A